MTDVHAGRVHGIFTEPKRASKGVANKKGWQETVRCYENPWDPTL